MSQIKLESWMLKDPIDVFIFDCDSTLSLMEGIDEIAEMNGVGAEVKAITQRCMAVTGITVTAYKERLEYVKPTLKQLNQLAEMYCEHQTPGAFEVIELLQSLGKKVYILSGGMKQSLLLLAQNLGIPPERVLAVDVYFDDRGHYIGFNEQSNLVQPEGKNREIEGLIQNDETSFLIGDGVSDWEARTAVTRFVGFAGISPKQFVKEHSNFYINCDSLFSVINLGLTYVEQLNLPAKYKQSYEQGLSDILNDYVLIKE